MEGKSKNKRFAPEDVLPHKILPEIRDGFPMWLFEIYGDCAKLYGSKNAPALERLIQKFLGFIRYENDICSTCPDRSYFMARRMHKIMYVLHLTYLSVKQNLDYEFWLKHMTELLLVYCRLEARALCRLPPTEETDSMVADRMMQAVWIFLEGSYSHMLQLLVQIDIHSLSKRKRHLFEPIFIKLLIFMKPAEMENNMEYFWHIFAFKTWKFMRTPDECKYLCELANLQPPECFIRKNCYKVLPGCTGNAEVTEYLLNSPLDINDFYNKYYRIFKSLDGNCYTESSRTHRSSLFDEIDQLTRNLSGTHLFDDLEIELSSDDEVETPPAPITQPRLYFDSDSEEDDPYDDLYVITVESCNFVPSWCTDFLNESKKQQLQVNTNISSDDTKCPEVLEKICTATQDLRLSNPSTMDEWTHFETD